MGKFEVVSLKVGSLVDKTRSHGECHSYAGAANLARIARKAFPNRTVLVLIPKPLAVAKLGSR